MTTRFIVVSLLVVLLSPALSYAETAWQSETLGLSLKFPAYWKTETLPSQSDLAKGGVLVKAERTPGIPAGVRFELELQPLTIKRSSQQSAAETLIDALKQTPKLQILKLDQAKISDEVVELRVKWKVAESRYTLESIYRILDTAERRLVASISGRVELVAGVQEELNRLWDSIRAE